MRRVLPLLVLAALAGDAAAQTRTRVEISNVRFGFGSTGGRSGAFKPGQWAPVYCDLECVRDTGEELLLVVETRDADDAVSEASVRIAPMNKGDRLTGNELGRIPYLKPGSSYASGLTVRIKGADSGRTYGETSDRTFSGIEPAAFIVLGVGTNLVGMRFPEGGGNAQQQGNEAGSKRNGWIYPATVTDVGHLPDQWFGYGAVDLLVLGTGADRSFWEALAAPQHTKRRKAIAEWVRRGGRMVIGLGTNIDVIDALPEIRDLLPAGVPPGGKKSVKSLPFTWQHAAAMQATGLISFGGDGEFAVATLQPRNDRATKTLLIDDPTRKAPLAVQGPYGLGRVTVFAFDLDRAPFIDWNQRGPFWENIVNQCGFLLPGTASKLEQSYGGSRYDDLNARLQGGLDFFEGVPVVSFGWVALFILVYIVLIGPVDYLFLKKVVRRLEWTWVTFPLVVVTVSAGAYFAAYALKGKDLKTNKVDVVDIDLAGRRIDGNAFFTLFSPRIQNYTVGVEPAGPLDGDPESGFVPAGMHGRDTIVSWQGRIPDRYSSSGGGLFAKRYSYHVEAGGDPTDPERDLYADGVVGVPIQVWTTKAFHGQYTAPFDPAKPPFTAELSTGKGDDTRLTGTITNHLPIPADRIVDAALFWRGRSFNLKDLPVGVPKAISESSSGNIGTDIKSWCNSTDRYPQGVAAYSGQTQPRGYSYGNSYDVGTTTNPNFRLWPVLFSDFSNDNFRENAPNATLRKLDQSWRVTTDRPEQAIVVFRVMTREGPAETMTTAPDAPSRLWLGGLPSGGGKRPTMQGTLKQETYVRVFIPVKTK